MNARKSSKDVGPESTSSPGEEGVESVAVETMDFTDVIRTLPDLFYRTDEQGRISAASDYAEELLGYPVAQLLGTPLADLYIDPEQYRDFHQRLRAQKGTHIRGEAALRHRDGHEVLVAIHARLRTGKEGRVFGTDGIARDITERYLFQQRLAESEDRFRRLSDVGTEAIFIHHQGQILDCNLAAQKMFGYSYQQFTRMFAWEVIDPRHVELAKAKVRDHYEKPYEVNGLRQDGSTFPMEIYSKHSQMGEMSVRVTSIRDLTESKRAEQSLRKLSQAVEQSPSAIVITDTAGLIEYINPAMEVMSGCSATKMRGRQLTDFQGEQARDEFGRMMTALADDREWRGEVLNRRPDGRSYWQQLSASVVTTADGGASHYLVICNDISLRKEQEQRILYQASFDSLTDLPNRSLARDRLSQELLSARRRNRKVALMFVDLDEFKAVNDTLGHEYGDQLLVEAASRLRGAVRAKDTVARFGGDEFLVIMGELDSLNAAETVAQKIVDVFKAPFVIERRDLITTASIGIAIFPDDGEENQVLLRQADAAMYQAKARGRDGYCFYNHSMNESAEQRLFMEGLLRKALVREQLELHYQPLIDGDTGAVVGAEALLRWHSPELGSVPPDRFIPLAEATGLIVPIGEWVIEQACHQAMAWLSPDHSDFRVAVNVSPRQFQSGALVETVARVLSETGLPAHCLEIEITEGVLLKKRSRTGIILNRLKAMGVRLSIDDFGTGYSSLAYLEHFPFDTLKIDRSFVGGIIDNAQRMTLVNTIILMAHGLGLEVIAEGVETTEEADYLMARGCNLLQGYLFGRPLSACRFTDSCISCTPGR